VNTPRHDGGTVAIRARRENQHGDRVAEADGTMHVANRR